MAANTRLAASVSSWRLARAVGRSCHRAQVCLAFRGRDGGAGELPVAGADAETGHRSIHDPDVVGADLVPKPAGPAVNHHANLALRRPESRRRAWVEDFPDNLHLEEMVTRAQADGLMQAPVDGPLAHPTRLGPLRGVPIITAGQVLPGAGPCSTAAPNPDSPPPPRRR